MSCLRPQNWNPWDVFLVKVLIFGLALISIFCAVMFLEGSRCTIIGSPARRCYEQKAQLWLEIYTTVSFPDHHNRSYPAFYTCGVVRDCQTSPCHLDTVKDRQIRCKTFRDDLYRIGFYFPYVGEVCATLGAIFTLAWLCLTFASCRT